MTSKEEIMNGYIRGTITRLTQASNKQNHCRAYGRMMSRDEEHMLRKVPRTEREKEERTAENKM